MADPPFRLPLPYQQGQLDTLCGVYAAVNAIRLALAADSRRLKVNEWQELFADLLISADASIGAVSATTYGVEPKPLGKLLKSGISHMADSHGIRLCVRRVLRREERPPLSELIRKLAELIRQPRSAILIGLSGHLDHWTVLRKVGPSSLELFDSAGYSRVAVANCRMIYEPPGKTSREHIILPRSIFRITHEPD